MKTVKISLNSIDKVKAFVNEVTKFDAEFDLVSGRYVIDQGLLADWRKQDSERKLVQTVFFYD